MQLRATRSRRWALCVRVGRQGKQGTFTTQLRVCPLTALARQPLPPPAQLTPLFPVVPPHLQAASAAPPAGCRSARSQQHRRRRPSARPGRQPPRSERPHSLLSGRQHQAARSVGRCVKEGTTLQAAVLSLLMPPPRSSTTGAHLTPYRLLCLATRVARSAQRPRSGHRLQASQRLG